MNTYLVTVVRNAFDWFGLDVTIQDNVATIGEGRIGLEANPLVLDERGVSGGYYFPETSFSVRKNTRYVDIILDENTQSLMVLVRSDEETERISHEYRILLRLMQRDAEESPWFVAEKEYV